MAKDQVLTGNLQTVKRRRKGMNVIRKRLADGTLRTYVYWRDGGRVNEPDPTRKVKIERRPRLATPNPTTRQLIADGAIRALMQRTSIRARVRGLPLSLSIEDVRRKLKRQRGRCAVTNLEFRYVQNEAQEYSTNPFGLSLDRLNNAEGYTVENTRLVLVAVNIALNEWGEQTFLEIARAALQHLGTSSDTRVVQVAPGAAE